MFLRCHARQKDGKLQLHWSEVESPRAAGRECHCRAMGSLGPRWPELARRRTGREREIKSMKSARWIREHLLGRKNEPAAPGC